MITVRSVSEAVRHVKRGQGVEATGVGGIVRIRRGERLKLWCSEFWRAGNCVVHVWHLWDWQVHDFLREWFPRLQGPDPRGDHRRNLGPTRVGVRSQYAPKAKGKFRKVT